MKAQCRLAILAALAVVSPVSARAVDLSHVPQIGETKEPRNTRMPRFPDAKCCGPKTPAPLPARHAMLTCPP